MRLERDRRRLAEGGRRAVRPRFEGSFALRCMVAPRPSTSVSSAYSTFYHTGPTTLTYSDARALRGTGF
jgi:hypothetical protein